MKFRSTVLASSLALLGTASLTAQAAFEDLTQDNSTLATAQVLGPLSDEGALNVQGLRGTVIAFGLTLIDNNNADFYQFTIGANRILTLSVDTAEGPLLNDDPMVALYSADGNLIAVDDDGGPGYDSMLSFTIGNPGIYYAAVTGYDDFDFNGVADIFEVEGSLEGANSPIPNTNFLYTLRISSVAGPDTNPVPVPAAGWLLGSALLGLARRRKAA